MSSIHSRLVGYFDLTSNKFVKRSLDESEVIKLFEALAHFKPDSAEVNLVAAIEEGEKTIGHLMGEPVIYCQKGYLRCPYIGPLGFNWLSITFIELLCSILGCNVYSEDDGALINPSELAPDNHFREHFVQVYNMVTRKV